MHPTNTLAKATPSTTAFINLEKILAMREAAKMLKERLATVENSLDQAEQEIMEAVDAGADFSALGYEVAIQESSRRYPKWKEEFLSRLGKSAADAVTESTPATIYRKLVITK